MIVHLLQNQICEMLQKDQFILLSFLALTLDIDNYLINLEKAAISLNLVK